MLHLLILLSYRCLHPGMFILILNSNLQIFLCMSNFSSWLSFSYSFHNYLLLPQPTLFLLIINYQYNKSVMSFSQLLLESNYNSTKNWIYHSHICTEKLLLSFLQMHRNKKKVQLNYISCNTFKGYQSKNHKREIMFLLHTRQASWNWRFNATFIFASQNTEISIITPIRIPRVGNKPVGGTLFCTPTQYPDGMTTKCWASYMLVHTCKNQITLMIFQ